MHDVDLSAFNGTLRDMQMAAQFLWWNVVRTRVHRYKSLVTIRSSWSVGVNRARYRANPCTSVQEFPEKLRMHMHAAAAYTVNTGRRRIGNNCQLARVPNGGNLSASRLRLALTHFSLRGSCVDARNPNRAIGRFPGSKNRKVNISILKNFVIIRIP